MVVFDRAALRRQRDRAAAGFSGADFLFREVADRLADRLLDIKRRFPIALDLGSRTGVFARTVGRRGGIETLFQCDLSLRMADRAPPPALVADAEFLPFREESLDLVVSTLDLHWVNDLPGALVQINRALKPDGLFLAAMLGGDTLHELRDCLINAEVEVSGGASPRISPFADLRDMGGLLQRAGFALPVIDSDTITVTYENAFRLMADLRAMGEGNVALNRVRRPSARTLFMRTAALYRDRHAGPDGRIPATFQVIYLHGWAPHSSQQKPLRPGMAKHRLAHALDAAEHATGAKAIPAGR